jgi:YVTN family beta-propeller protein
MSRTGSHPLSLSRVATRLTTMGALLAAVGGLTAGAASPIAAAQPAGAPKAYIGLFKDNAVAVLDTGTNQVTTTIPIPAGPHGLVVTPDGKRVYASSDGDSTVSVIDTSDDAVTDTIQVGPMPHGLAITPDGSQVLVAGFGTDQVEAISTASNQVTWQVPVPQPHNIAVTPDGKTAYVASQKQGSTAVAILDLGSGAEIGSVPVDQTPRALSVNPNGEDLVYTLAGNEALQVLDLTSRQVETQIPVGASPHQPLFTSDGKLGLAVVQGPGTLDFFDPATYTKTGSVKVGDMPHWIGLGSDDKVAYVTNENSNTVSVVDLGARQVTATIPVGNAPRKIVVQPGALAPMNMGSPAAQPAAGANAAPTVPAPSAPSAPAASTAGGVSIANFAFSPATLTVPAGQSVTFTNNDSVAHTSTATNGSWDSGEIQPGASFTVTLQQPGTYTYRCSIHPFMQGTVVVQ